MIAIGFCPPHERALQKNVAIEPAVLNGHDD